MTRTTVPPATRRRLRCSEKAQFTPEEAARNKLLHSAETILAEEVFSVPLFARPQHLLHSNKVRGALRNPTLQGGTWNAETWSVAS